MVFTYSIQIFLKIDKHDKIDFEYLYNENTKFQDLLEYISSFSTNLNLCSCYAFKIRSNNQYKRYDNYDEIDIDKTTYSIFRYNKKVDLLLFKKKTICTCDELIKKYMRQSKIIIINELNFENEKLKRKITQKENEIKLLNDEKKEFENQIYKLKKEKDSQNKEKENLIEKKKENENEINKLKDKINENENLYKSQIQKLKEEKKALELAIDGDYEIINRVKQIGVNNISDLKPKDDIIKIGENNQILGENKEYFDRNQFINFYDVIVDIKSIKDINKGWEIKLNKDNYIKYKNELTIKIGVIGNSNKGKSFLLSKISKIKLPSGTSIRTEGLSIKYPDLSGSFKDRRIVLLDSAGLETPVLKDEGEKEEKEEIEEKEEKEENGEKNPNIEMKERHIKEKEGEECKAETEETIDNGQQMEIQKQTTPKEKKEDIKKIKIFQEKSREKLITEIFLQNYIIYNSNILIIVIGILSYSEQKLLNRIRNEIKRNGINKPLFIIHNLITYTTEQQVEDYIKDFLLKSVTFNLEEGHKITTKTVTKSGKYFYEKNTDPKVFHLLFANEGSEAGQIYNEFTLQFLENNYQNVTDLKPFDVVETIKERFSKISNDIMEKTENIEFDSKAETIKLNNPKSIILKKCLIDELGFSNLRSNGFEPAYNYYKKDNKIIVRVEAPGNCNLESEVVFSGEYNVIKITGEKKKDKEPKELSQNIINKRELGQFSLNIYLKTDEYLLKDEQPSSDIKKGVYILEYELAEKKSKKQITVNKEEEI